MQNVLFWIRKILFVLAIVFSTNLAVFFARLLWVQLQPDYQTAMFIQGLLFTILLLLVSLIPAGCALFELLKKPEEKMKKKMEILSMVSSLVLFLFILKFFAIS